MILDDQDTLDTFYNEDDFAEPFEVSPMDGSLFTELGIWNNQDSPFNFNETSSANDSPTVTFRTYRIQDYDLDNAVIKRISTGITYYAKNVGPDINGERLINLSRTPKQ